MIEVGYFLALIMAINILIKRCCRADAVLQQPSKVFIQCIRVDDLTISLTPRALECFGPAQGNPFAPLRWFYGFPCGVTTVRISRRIDNSVGEESAPIGVLPGDLSF